MPKLLSQLTSMIAKMQDSDGEAGIWVICNKVNGKVLVGRTTRGFAAEERDNFNALRAKRHRLNHLQAAWNKYGEAAFEFSPVEQCSAADLDARYKHYVQEFSATDGKFGYNSK